MAETEEFNPRNVIQELKKQWNQMWRERVDDRFKGEGIAAKNYEKLFIERGLVVIATRDFKPLSFSDVVRKHVPQIDEQRLIQPNIHMGGWGKFARDFLPRHGSRTISRKRQTEREMENKSVPPKKKGRGWLHRF